MTDNFNRPTKYDAVLGGHTVPSSDAAVLGGIERIIQRLADPNLEIAIAALGETLKYEDQGLDLLFKALEDEAQPISQAADLLIQIILKSKHLDPSHQKSWKILEQFLATQKWRKADEITQEIMLKICDRHKDGYLRKEDLAKFPILPLQTIDRLWLKYSQRDPAVQRRGFL
jgi:hypothetical protein